MTARLLVWYGERAPRERLLLLIAAVLAVVALFFLISVPVTDALAAAKSRHADAVLALGETQARVDAIKAAQTGRMPAPDAPLDTLIRTRADAAGFALTNVSLQGSDRVQISIASARPGALLAWIADLEQAGLLVDTLGTTDNGDHTVAVTMLLKSQGA